jgi:hypothetical protein
MQCNLIASHQPLCKFTNIAGLTRTEKVRQLLRPKKSTYDPKCSAAVLTYISVQALSEPAHLCKKKESHLLPANDRIPISINRARL